MALLLGVFLIAGILQIFISAKQSYRTQEAMSRLQENGRFAMEFIGKDVRMADYRQCATTRSTSLYELVGGTKTTIIGSAAIAGAEGNDGKPDSLFLRWLDQPCGTISPTFGQEYSISTTQTLLGIGGDIVEGVENMQILYGIDSDGTGTANYYVPYSSINLPTNTTVGSTSSPATPNLDQIVSVRVSLLLRTLENNIASEALSYTFPPWPVNNQIVTITPTVTSNGEPDRYIRRVFTSTFALRNRLK